MDETATPAAMRAAARELLTGLRGAARAAVARPFDDPQRRRLEYRPSTRPGLTLGELDPAARKHAHRLLATALSPHAYAQAMAIIALEEVLDRREDWRRGRHSNDYSAVVYGDPDGDTPWSWRFEGHHLSLTMTLRGDEIWPTPVFFGANPARVDYVGQAVLRPLGPEEDVAYALLSTLEPEALAVAVVAPEAPSDIRSGPTADRPGPVHPLGVAWGDLDPVSRALLDQLIGVYLARLPADLARAQAATIDPRTVHFAWEGPLARTAGHYYRIQAGDLLIEFDNRDNDANHAHTVLRRPGGDFGDILAAHHATHH